MNIGMMLGRLSEKYNQPLQSFPINNWEEEFDNAARIGFDSIEWVEDGFSDKENPLFNSGGRQSLKDMQKIKKVYIHSVCAHSFISGGFISSNKVEREIWIDRLKLIIDCSNEIGSDVIILPLMDDFSINSIEKEELLIDSFSKIPPLPSHLKILVETDLSAKTCLNLLNKIDRSDLGIVYDLGNSTQLNHDLHEDIKCLHHIIGEVHLKDKDNSASFRLGNGNTDFEAAFKALRECKWQGRFVLETPIFNNWQQEAEKNFLFAKRLISSIESA
jgi:sugar phosphate isomerase/epimerase